MTPTQRKYDQDLILAMQMMANWIEPRSRKVSLTLKLAAERISALASALPADPAVQLDQHGNKIQPVQAIANANKIQPHSAKKIKSSPRQRRSKNR